MNLWLDEARYFIRSERWAIVVVIVMIVAFLAGVYT
jgi:hypothetical protein